VIPVRDAIVLAAGLGTRLRPLTSVRAKPAIPVAGEPLIRRIVRQLARDGVQHLVVNLHHLPATLTAVLGDGSDLGARVRYSWEQPLVLGSAGGPRQALPIVGARTFFIVNGDTLANVDLGRLASAHAASGALVTMALMPNREPLRYGGVLLDDSCRVTGFVGRGSQASGSFHFVGVQVASADAFQPLPAGVPVNSVGQAYDRLLTTRPGCIRGVVADTTFRDIGTVADYLETSRAIEIAEDAHPTSRPSAVDPSARVVRSILWDEVEIGAGADLEHCIVTDRVRVPPGSRYREAILLAGPGRAPVAVPLEASHG
jgi:NDP-sugar pyrophosphorylase family protein